jgi:hypothetical protein
MQAMSYSHSPLLSAGSVSIAELPLPPETVQLLAQCSCTLQNLLPDAYTYWLCILFFLAKCAIGQQAVETKSHLSEINHMYFLKSEASDPAKVRMLADLAC